MRLKLLLVPFGLLLVYFQSNYQMISVFFFFFIFFFFIFFLNQIFIEFQCVLNPLGSSAARFHAPARCSEPFGARKAMFGN